MKTRILFFLIILLSAFIRLPYLGTLPPGGENAFWLRLPTSIFGIASIILLMSIVKKLSKNNLLTLASGLMLTIMPWHLEQSRVFSPAMLALTVLMGSFLAYLHLKKNLIRYIIILVGVSLAIWLMPDILLSTAHLPAMKPKHFVYNAFKLVSFELIFFTNDTFWWGGFRTIGMLLPSLIPAFIIGLIMVARKLTFNHWPMIVFLLSVWILSATHPQFPEQRIFFLISPFFALVIAFGIKKLWGQFSTSNILIKTLIVVFLILPIYESVIFTHFYIKHYPLRIKHELPKESRNF